MKLYKITKYEVTTSVGDLIAELQKCDPKAYVFTEGCDCIGNVVSVYVEESGTVLLGRDDNILRYVQGGDSIVVDKYADRVVDKSEDVP